MVDNLAENERSSSRRIVPAGTEILNRYWLLSNAAGSGNRNRSVPRTDARDTQVLNRSVPRINARDTQILNRSAPRTDAAGSTIRYQSTSGTSMESQGQDVIAKEATIRKRTEVSFEAKATQKISFEKDTNEDFRRRIEMNFFFFLWSKLFNHWTCHRRIMAVRCVDEYCFLLE